MWAVSIAALPIAIGTIKRGQFAYLKHGFTSQ